MTRFLELGCRLAPLARASVLKHSEMRMKKGVKKAAEMRGCPLDFCHILHGVFFGGEICHMTIALEWSLLCNIEVLAYFCTIFVKNEF